MAENARISDENLQKARDAVSGEPGGGGVEVFEELEHGSLHLGRFRGIFVTILAVSWSLFQLALPSVIVVASEYSRAIHLAFAIALVYLTFGPKRFAARSTAAKKPAEKPRAHWKTVIGWLWKPFSFVFHWIAVGYRAIFNGLHRLPGGDYALAIIAAAAALYLPLNYAAISQRIGNPTSLDITIGIVLLIFLLEAARRAVGPALAVLAVSFIILSFNTQSLPQELAFKNANVDGVINTLTLGTGGVYGIPLDVSTSIIFLFVLFGSMLAHAGGGQYFINLAFAAVGHLRAGPAMGAVLASGLTGLVSGSSIANTVTTGTFTIPLMKRCGYTAEKAGAVEVAASTNGQLMPPIMGAAAFIMMEYTSSTYFEVVKAAIIPALLSYLALIYITRLEAAKLDLRPIPRSELPPFWKTFYGGLHFLLPLFMLIYMLVIARLSPQLSVFYAILVMAGLVLVDNLVKSFRAGTGGLVGLKNAGLILLKSLEMGARNMVPIGVAVAAAGVIVGIVSLGLGNMITSVIEVLSGGQIVPLLFITAIFSLILGMGLPTTANYIVMASLTAPAIVGIAEANGYDIPLIAAHLFCFYFGILSDDTPPVGLSAYAAAAISRGDPIATGIQGFTYDIRTALLPFMFVFNTDLILHGVTEWWRILLIFGTGLLALLAFASLTQGWLRRRNTFIEGVLLAVVVFTLMQPHFTSDTLGIPSWAVWIFGIALLLALYFGQPYWNLRSRKARAVPNS